MSKAPRLPARVFGVAALVLSGWLPASPLLAAPAVQVGFSPEGSAQQLVLSVIGEAQRDIRLMGYAFTSPEVARALIAAHRRGVGIWVVVDAKANQNGAGRAALNLLANAGVNVRTVNSYKILHDKVIVVDGVTIETGSFNFSRAAHRANSENVVVLRDMPEVAKQYMAHWQSRWAQGQDWQSTY
ncbi:phospholipase D family nuclease [Serratia marcescens]|uniref:phospholipase D n=1 Tax=Serratia marcescens TaxID=615 RepID=A0A8X6JS64_SERMA|nr:phospholipase D family protein [Serratia marcescens]BCG07156.1 phospholipase D precursor [Serratia marcescens]BCG07248.1 phospholipase D precursor [Serratia marcescens]BCG07360.1 phospholipase D precursor [Serratia marcescens]BCT02778.1 phospholipase D precursor [Serratia marcescens]BCT02870.1 phospholipase D precursor [Serratia marcescens]